MLEKVGIFGGGGGTKGPKTSRLALALALAFVFSESLVLTTGAGFAAVAGCVGVADFVED